MFKKINLIFIIGAIVFMLSISPAEATGGKKNGPEIKPQKYFYGYLYLFEKDPSTWERIPEGAWGKMKYKLWYSKFWFIFNGHALTPGEEYMLIYYPDPWPGEGLIVLGAGVANDGGNIIIKGWLEEVCDLPADHDENYGYGAKIWLVKASDVHISHDNNKMIGWNPHEYLFEYNLIYFDNTECEYGIPFSEGEAEKTSY